MYRYSLKKIHLKHGFVFFYSLIILGFFMPLSHLQAQGNLLINPIRVIFDGNKRIEELNLANIGKDSAIYQISFIQLRMKEDGNFEEITSPDSGQRFAEPYLRFFPRKVKLGPNEAQVLKVQLSKTNGLAPGEYRSHLYFRAIPRYTAKGEEEDTKSISVKITPVFGISIPMIIRIGETHASVNISNIALSELSDSSVNLNMRFNRTGNRSVYGNILVRYKNAKGARINLAEADGVAVYTPNTSRYFKMNLKKLNGVDFHSGQIEIIYQSNLNGVLENLALAQYSL